MTGVGSAWGRASRSTRAKHHTCQQFVVEFGRVSVNVDVLLGEASRAARLLADSKRYQHGGTLRAHLDSHIEFKRTLYLQQTDTSQVVHRQP